MMADDPQSNPPPGSNESEDVNVLSGVPTAETPPGQLPAPQQTDPGPLPVPNPPGANPPHHSVTYPLQYPPYEKVSDAPHAGAAPRPPEGTGQYVGQSAPPEAATRLERPADPDREDASHP
jgi:hypothetical protein